jgi:Arc/MetJ-type ribon-helix-helix transcriptional regulator
MTDADGEEIVTFRLAPRDRAAIRRLVEEGEFRNRSDFLRFAVKAALRDVGAAGRPAAPPLDLELEDYELSPQEAQTRKAGRGRRHNPSEMTRS